MVNEAQGKYLIYNGNVEETELSDRFENIDMPIYEVVAVRSGVVLFLEDHLERLKSTINSKGLTPTRTLDEIQADMYTLIDKNDIDTGYIKMILTDDRTLIYEHWDMDREESIDVSILDYDREDPNLKVLDNDYKTAVNKLMMDQGTYEVILRNDQGELVEGGRSNLYFIKDGKVLTAPVDRVLPGIRRKVLMRVLEDLGISLVEEIVSDYQLLDIDAGFISGTTVGITPIENIESININSLENELMKDIIKEYERVELEYISSKS